MFLQEWDREIEAIRKDPERAASYLPEDRLYRGVFEALKLAHSAQRMRGFGGVRIVEVRDRAIKATATSPRPGAFVDLAAGAGEASRTVVVALTKVEASKSFVHDFNALFASAQEVTGAILIHPKRDLDLGATTRGKFVAALDSGKLRPFPLEDYPRTDLATECLAALPFRAGARELVHDGVALSAEDRRDLVLKTGVIDNLELFKMLGRWKSAAKAAGPHVEPPVATQANTPPSPSEESHAQGPAPEEPEEPPPRRQVRRAATRPRASGCRPSPARNRRS